MLSLGNISITPSSLRIQFSKGKTLSTPPTRHLAVWAGDFFLSKGKTEVKSLSSSGTTAYAGIKEVIDWG
ncbi:hypothetical protein AYI71_14835 [Limosilactobacillus oris]|nr:hypothetical protein AYI71_14835 [Limosilactobacillus oris]